MVRVSRWLQVGALLSALFAAAPTGAQPVSPTNAPPPAPAEPSPLLSEPKTPEELFSSTLLLIDLARFDLAQKYLQAFVDGEPSDELLLALRDQFGTAEFLRMSRVKELRPLALKLVDRLNVLAKQQAEDPAFVDGLIARLSGTPAAREVAIRELRSAGPRAIPQMLRQLGSTKDAGLRDLLVVALSRMGSPSLPAIIGGLDASNEAVRLGCLEAIQNQRAAAATPFLWSQAFSPAVSEGVRLAAQRALAEITLGDADRTDQLNSATAVAALEQQADALYAGVATTQSDDAESDAETVTVWTWSDAEGTVVGTDVPVATANLHLAAHLAHEALILSPERPAVQQLYLGARLAWEVQKTGWDQPLEFAPGGVLHAAVSAGEPMLLEVLRRALEIGRADTAWATLQALSQVTSPQSLTAALGRKSPVLSALNYPDPRIQFAAAIVVLRSDPRQPFSGTERVVEILRRALTDPGLARALVIDPDRERAATVSGFLAEQGFDPLTVATGREGFTEASQLAGVDFVVLHVNSVRWELTQTLSNLRADARTAFLPVIVYGPEDSRDKVARLLRRSQPAIFVGEAASAAAFWEQVGTFLTRRKTPAPSAQQRAEFKSLAAYWLATIAAGGGARVFNIAPAEAELLPLVDDADVAANALVALGSLPSAHVQQRLAQFALTDRLPIETRERAAAQLAAHIGRRGLLISPDEVRELSTAFATADDPAVRNLLAPVMGALRPNAGLIGERLQRLPAARR